MVSVIGRKISTLAPASATSGSPEEGLGGIFSAIAKPYLDPSYGLRQAQRGLFEQKTSDAERQSTGIMSGAMRAARGEAFDSPGMISDWIMAGNDPKQLATFNKIGTFGRGVPLDGDAATRASLAAGDSYGNTVAGTNAAEANKFAMQKLQEQTKLRIDDNKPTNIEGPDGPTITRQGDAVGMQPVLDTGQVKGGLLSRNFGNLDKLNGNQQTVLGAAEKPDQFYNYAVRDPADPSKTVAGVTTDGKVDLRTGAALPNNAPLVSTGNAGGTGVFQDPNALTAGARDTAQTGARVNDQLINTTQMMRDIVNKDPTVVGPSGVAQKWGQNFVDLIGNVSQALGGDNAIKQQVDSLRGDIVAMAQKNGVDPNSIMPGIFKPNINQLEALHSVLVYQAAQALSDQSGHGMSDRDVAAARNLVGDPQSLFQGPSQFLTKLNTIEYLAKGNRDRFNSMLRGNSYGATPTQPAAPAPQPQGPLPTTAPTLGRPQQGPPMPSATGAARPVAVHPETGQKVEFDGTNWVPAQ